jgi:hypothetical protein
MATLPKSLFWQRVDTPGVDHALVDDRRGLHARGVAIAAEPVPYTCRYEVFTDDAWVTAHLDVVAEGAGWMRSARLERAAGRWRVTTAEQGDLDAALRAGGHPPAQLAGIESPNRLAHALDVDLSAAPLLNTLPVRRLGLLHAAAGTTHTITVAWVVVPSLQVIPAEQVYTVLGGRMIRFRSDSFRADLEFDADGYVTHYPGLAQRPVPERLP